MLLLATVDALPVKLRHRRARAAFKHFVAPLIRESFGDPSWQHRYAGLIERLEIDFVRLHMLATLLGCARGVRATDEVVNCLSLLAPLYDHVFDDEAPSYSLTLLHADRVKAIVAAGWLEGTLPRGELAPVERILSILCTRLAASLPAGNRWPFFLRWLELHEEQVESIRYSHWRQGEPFSTRELTLHTLKKGGLATLLFAYAQDRPLSTEEEKLFFLVGGMAQLLDDLVDMTRDAQSTAITLTTQGLLTAQDMHLVTHLVTGEIERLVRLKYFRKLSTRHAWRLFDIIARRIISGIEEHRGAAWHFWRLFDWLLRGTVTELGQLVAEVGTGTRRAAR